MPAIAVTGALFIIGFEQLVEWQYGPLGIIGMLLLTVGIKARNATCSSLGAVVLAMLVAGPALG